MSQIVGPFADQYMMLGMTHMSWHGPVVRLLALLAARCERWDESIAHFEDAIARVRRLGARPHLARTEYELGRTLLARGLTADRPRAFALLESAVRTATDLNMPGMDGYHFLEKLQEQGEAPPTIVLTAFGNIETGVRTVHLAEILAATETAAG